MFRVFSIFIFALLPIGASGEIVTTTDGRQITLNDDGTFVIKAAITEKVSNFVEILKPFFERHITEYQEHSIRFMPKVKNKTGKAIVGIKFRTIFKDAFGEEILSFAGDISERIDGGSSSKANVFYVFKDNQFISGEFYDKLLPMIDGDTGTTETVISKIAFSDGEIVDFSKK